jgi:hypothetical protein
MTQTFGVLSRHGGKQVIVMSDRRSLAAVPLVDAAPTIDARRDSVWRMEFVKLIEQNEIADL